MGCSSWSVQPKQPKRPEQPEQPEQLEQPGRLKQLEQPKQQIPNLIICNFLFVQKRQKHEH